MMRILIFFCSILLAGCASQPVNNKNTLAPGVNQVEAAKTRVSLGLTYLKNGNYVQAKTNLDKALEFAPRLGDAHFALAFYYQQVSEWEIARQYYEQAMHLDSNNPDLINSYGAFLCEIGEYREAKENLLRAINIKTYNRSAESYENLAICSHRQGNIGEAMNYLRSALQHQPGRARSWYMLVELLLAKKQWQEAKVAYRQYEKVVPVTADTLNLAIEIENGLGNANIAQGYADMLQTLYPERVGLPRTVILAPSQVNYTQPEQQSAGISSELAGKDVVYHVLQKGETLYQISRRYNVRVQTLVDWNNIKDVADLSIGQRIIVSNPY
ncbi:type IV pilus biogenesis/stability protein PilW [Planctobacterium marinum]|uniref:LysM domain-containing protein n=1 Tax=Planctobacterium marinum TaxID=1631968 RepID=A0AA48HSD5_9ALTE|nr:hypothetical protein MACH26_33630 [Planctobacterium marinum]